MTESSTDVSPRAAQKARLQLLLSQVATPFQRFVQHESAAGLLLFATAIAGFAWANSPWKVTYFSLLEARAGFDVGAFSLKKTALHWVNDGLMAVFFLLVGLEIKRELIVGALSDRKQAALAVFAAIGGMVVPAGIFLIFNAGTAAQSGWAIPMATDIAFALGIISLLGKRVPMTLKLLLTALAIVDDLGAVLVIALFYSKSISGLYLGLAAGCVVLSALGNLLGVRHLGFYMIIGAVLWYFTLKSGVHATIAGVALALTIPLGVHDALEQDDLEAMLTRQLTAGDFETVEARVSHLERALEAFQSPLHRLEQALHGPVAYVILPVFALINAGVTLGASATTGLSAGIAGGLIAGKVLGISVFSWLACKVGLARKPDTLSWSQLLALSVVASVGFTMSLFVTGLAFTDPSLLNEAKTAVLGTSLVGAVVGVIALLFTTRPTPLETSPGK